MVTNWRSNAETEASKRHGQGDRLNPRYPIQMCVKELLYTFK
jgi:hypothetical protein